jgi:hypothetical protein
MPARKLPTPHDAAAARRMLLDGLARDADILELVSELAPLHPSCWHAGMLAHRHAGPVGSGTDVGDRREQGVLPEVVGLPPGGRRRG